MFLNAFDFFFNADEYQRQRDVPILQIPLLMQQWHTPQQLFTTTSYNMSNYIKHLFSVQQHRQIMLLFDLFNQYFVLICLFKCGKRAEETVLYRTLMQSFNSYVIGRSLLQFCRRSSTWRSTPMWISGKRRACFQPTRSSRFQEMLAFWE